MIVRPSVVAQLVPADRTGGLPPQPLLDALSVEHVVAEELLDEVAVLEFDEADGAPI